MIPIAVLSVMVAQTDRNSAIQRRNTGASNLVSDSAIARAMVQLNNPNNGILLTRNYDPRNPKTGKNYLGADSTPDSGDETTQPLDEWTGYDPSSTPCFRQIGRVAPNLLLTGTLGTNQTYLIRAYRYNEQKKLGTLLIEGTYQGQSSLVAVTLTIEPILDDFPSVLLMDTNPGNTLSTGVLALRGRNLLGRKGNIYYSPPGTTAPSLTGISKVGDISRANYLNAVWSTIANDGATGDTVQGTIFACRLNPDIPVVRGNYSPVINTSTNLEGVGGTTPTVFQVDKIDLANNHILKVDTTNGPVRIELTDRPNIGGSPDITLRNTAKIMNVRNDGKLPQVGDLRIIVPGHSQTTLYDQTCIQNAFLYAPQDELRILTSGPGCPGGNSTNFEGVVWAEAVLSSKNASGNRDVNYLGHTGENYDTTITSGARSGIAVPDDLSSLSDLIKYVDWPARYKYGAIKNWQRVNEKT